MVQARMAGGRLAATFEVACPALSSAPKFQCTARDKGAAQALLAACEVPFCHLAKVAHLIFNAGASSWLAPESTAGSTLPPPHERASFSGTNRAIDRYAELYIAHPV